MCQSPSKWVSGHSNTLSHSVIIPSPPPSLFQLWHGAMQIPNQPHLRRVHREATERGALESPRSVKAVEGGKLGVATDSKHRCLSLYLVCSSTPSATLLQHCLPAIARLSEG